MSGANFINVTCLQAYSLQAWLLRVFMNSIKIIIYTDPQLQVCCAPLLRIVLIYPE